MSGPAPRAHAAAHSVLSLVFIGGPTTSSADAVRAAVTALEKLRLHLVRLVGTGGYHALLSRAVSLSRSDVQWLAHVSAGPDARLVRFEGEAAERGADEVERGTCVLLTHLLSLLMTFVGEELTMLIVRDVWPDLTEAREYLTDGVDSGDRVGPGDLVNRAGSDARPEGSGE